CSGCGTGGAAGWGPAASGAGAAGAGVGVTSNKAVAVAGAAAAGCAFLVGGFLRAGCHAENGQPSWADAGSGIAASNSAQPASTNLMPLPFPAPSGPSFAARCRQAREAVQHRSGWDVRNLRPALLLGCAPTATYCSRTGACNRLGAANPLRGE